VTNVNGVAASTARDVDSGTVYNLTGGVLTVSVPPGDGMMLSIDTPLVLEYQFNETGAVAANTGTVTVTETLQNSAGAATDLHSADAGGVSGLPGDTAFDNTASTGMGNAGTGGRGTHADWNALDGLKSFTLSGWFKASSPIGNAARLFDKAVGATGFTLFGDGGGLRLVVNGANAGTVGTSSYKAVNSWVFFAVTYDGTLAANNLKYYVGTKTSAVALLATQTLNKGPALGNTLAFSIGNISSSFNRPFDGLLDNMRLFASPTDNKGVLSQAALESYRASDL
jgi:hypothetical protein